MPTAASKSSAKHTNHEKLSILFVARELSIGGAERQLAITAVGLSERGHDVTIVVFYEEGGMKDLVVNSKVRVIGLGKKSRWDNITPLLKLANIFKKANADVIYSYLPMPNVISTISKLLTNSKLAWGVRGTTIELSHYDWSWKLSNYAEVLLSRFVDLVISNSCSGARDAANRGFKPTRTAVIPNGIDVNYFKAIEDTQTQRSEWGVGPEEKLVGIIGRLDPMKGHLDFIRAASLVALEVPQARFICVGEGPVSTLEELKGAVLQRGLEDLFLWPGRALDMPTVYSSLDLCVSSSLFGEGFSNTISEAMACGTSCVATSVGDSAYILGDAGIVVPPGNPKILAASIVTSLSSPTPGEVCRARIASQFSLEKCIDRTENALYQLTTDRALG